MYKYIKKSNLQFLRFIISGAIASIFNYVIYISIYFIFKNLIIASLSGYIVGIFVSFIFAKIWVFKNSLKKPIINSFILFSFIYFLGGLEMSFTIIFLNQYIGNHKIAWFFGALIGSLNNYFGSKYFLFRN